MQRRIKQAVWIVQMLSVRIRLAVLVVLIIIAVFIVFFFLPFVSRVPYGSSTLFIVLIIANAIAIYYIHKGVFPKPTSRERKITLAFLTALLIVVFAVGILSGILLRMGIV
jgi:hypothetical protein